MVLRASLCALALIGCANARHALPDGDNQPPKDSPGGDDAERDAAPPVDSADGSGSGGGCAAFSGVLATWDFTGAAGSQAATDAKTTASGVTAGSVTRSAGLNAVAGANSINSSAWPTSAQLDPAKYYTLSITPPMGCTLSLTSAAVDAKASGTGPTMASIATSADAFAQTAAVSTTAPSTPTLAVSGASGTVEVRIYGFAASAGTGTFRIQNMLSVTGSLQ